MRISFLVIFASISLLEICHHADALGVDSMSHGLLSGGRVVRRYGNFGGGNLFNKRYSVRLRGLQERADPPKGTNDPPKEKAKDDDKDDDKKDDDKKDDGKKDDGKKGDGKKDDQKENDVPVPAAPEISDKEPTKEPTKEPVKEPVKEPAKSPATNDATNDPTNDPKNDPKNDPSDTDTTSANQDQAPATDAGTPTVPTGMSSSAVAGLVSIGGVFVLVAGLFAFSKRRKNKEMTRNIMNNSAKAWEQQNSTYEKMEEETNPIGSYTVIATYTPTLSDELDIQPGDKVTILVEFDDGWVQGINETRGGTKGVFPRHCVDMDHLAPSNINNKRSSSIGVFADRYTEVDLN